MVYHWEPHRETCYQLYVVEKKSLDEVVEYMRDVHNFAPSRRGFQTQFSKWNFPAKYRRVWKNEQLVERVRELWEQNYKQKEMLERLKEDGYDIEMRELVNVRSKFKLRLRANQGGFGALGAEEEEEGEGEQGDDDDAGDEGGYETAHERPPSRNSGTPVNGLLRALTAEEMARKEEKKRLLELEIMERGATKKRRRHTKPFAGMPPDPPGPPRFPSETTLEESKTILELNKDEYNLMRKNFQRICEENGIWKKAEAAEKWETAKEQLVRESMHLRAIMWDHANEDQKRLAIDVIACDVTKRMRTAETFMPLAEAKRILGLSPLQGNELRSMFYKILCDDGFTYKTAEGQEHWDELKQKWFAGSELLAGLAAQPDPKIQKAINVLARDVMRRQREDQNRRLRGEYNPKPPKPPPKPKAPKVPKSPKGPPKPRGRPRKNTRPEDSNNLVFGDSNSPPTPPRRQQAQANPTPSPRRRTQAQQTPTHSHARFLPPEPIASPQSALPMDPHAQLNPLLLSEPQSFVSETYYAPASTQSASLYRQAQAPVQSTTMAVYFRLHPESSLFPGTVISPMWISTISSRSLEEVRSAATEKFTDVVCMAVQGVIKDGKGGELVLAVHDDAQLEAYLAHVGGMVPPTFAVQLVEGRGEWV
ncbi:hypothetical protein OQA88_3551 [Cercophora sp. LCS_1]